MGKMADEPQLKVKVVYKGRFGLPTYKTPFSAGMDLHAEVEASFQLLPLERKLIPTGLHIELPIGYEAQVRSRSGLALKHGLSVLNSPGTVDADYRGEIGVILVNLSNEPYTVEPGERIAQLVIQQHARAEWVEVNELNQSERGEGGFGSTGIKHPETKQQSK